MTLLFVVRKIKYMHVARKSPLVIENLMKTPSIAFSIEYLVKSP